MQLSCCEVGVRLHVEVPAQSFELTLAAKTQVEVKSRHKNSTDYLSCHTEAYHRRAPEVTRTLPYLV